MSKVPPCSPRLFIICLQISLQFITEEKKATHMALSTYPIYEHPKKTDSDTLKCGFCIGRDMQPHKKQYTEHLYYPTAVEKF